LSQAILLGRVHSDDEIKSIGESTRGMLFLGTPHGGSSLAKWASIGLSFTKLFAHTNNKNIKILQEDSEKLKEVGEKFPLVLMDRASTPESKIMVTCFYETLQVDNVGMVRGYIHTSVCHTSLEED